MTAFILKRLAQTVPTLLAVTVFTFLLLYIVPGDPVANLAGQRADAKTIENIRRKIGLDKPLHTRYFNYLSDLCRGDLGRSYFSKIPVRDAIAERFPKTVQLALAAMVIATVMGVSIGAAGAVRPGGWTDVGGLAFALAGVSVPVFWFGLILVILFAWKWPILPPSGYGEAVHLVLPAVCLGARPAAYIARITRSSLLETLNADYVKTARAKGLGEGAVVFRHAFRNAMIPVVTLIGLDFGSYLNGSVITETIFGWPGFGRLVYQAINQRDIPLVMGCILFGAFVFVGVNFVVDVLYAVINPKVRRA